MATLTTEQQNNLWTNRIISEKSDCNGGFECYTFSSDLDGYKYGLIYLASEGVITGDDTITQIEPIVKSDLSNLDYKGVLPTETNEII